MQFFAGPCFAGGCFIGAALLLPASWSRRGWGIAALLAAGVAGLLLTWPNLVAIGPYAQGNRDIVVWHVIVFGLMGIALPCAAVLDLYRQRLPPVIAVGRMGVRHLYVHHPGQLGAHGRAHHAHVPAIGILAVRAIDRAAKKAIHPGWLSCPWPSARLFHFCLRQPTSKWPMLRDAVRMIHDRAAGIHHTIWFDGHWGFQWYMDARVRSRWTTTHQPCRPAICSCSLQITLTFTRFRRRASMGRQHQHSRHEFCQRNQHALRGGVLQQRLGAAALCLFAPNAEEFKAFRVTQTLLPPATQPITQPATTISNPR